MNPLSRSIRALAARLCCRRTLERLIDPILADIELEYREHIEAGRVWRARLVVLRGYGGLMQAVALHALRVCRWALVFDEPAKQTVWFSLGAWVVLTIALTLPPLLGPHVDGVLALYLVPQAIPLSIPLALAIGIGCGWSKGTTGRDMLRRVALLGMAGAIVAAATLEWFMPAASRAYRATVVSRFAESGRAGTVTMPRGINERSLTELAALIRQTAGTRPFVDSEDERVLADLQEINAAMPRGRHITANDLKLALYPRLALCFSTAALGLLAVATAAAIRNRNLARTVFAGLVVLYVSAWLGGASIVDVVPPAVSAWAPNAAAAAISLMLLGIASHRSAVTALRHD